MNPITVVTGFIIVFCQCVFSKLTEPKLTTIKIWGFVTFFGVKKVSFYSKRCKTSDLDHSFVAVLAGDKKGFILWVIGKNLALLYTPLVVVIYFTQKHLLVICSCI